MSSTCGGYCSHISPGSRFRVRESHRVRRPCPYGVFLSVAFCLGSMHDQASRYAMTGGPTLEELRDAVRKAESEVQACDPAPEQLRADVAEAERVAAENGGASYKTSRAVDSLKIKWELFVDVHGVLSGENNFITNRCSFRGKQLCYQSTYTYRCTQQRP